MTRAIGGPSSNEDLRELAKLAERLQERWQGSRVGLLVDRDLAFGVTRMFQAYAEAAGPDFQVFREREAAIAWLAAPGDEDA